MSFREYLEKLNQAQKLIVQKKGLFLFPFIGIVLDALIRLPWFLYRFENDITSKINPIARFTSESGYLQLHKMYVGYLFHAVSVFFHPGSFALNSIILTILLLTFRKKICQHFSSAGKSWFTFFLIVFSLFQILEIAITAILPLANTLSDPAFSMLYTFVTHPVYHYSRMADSIVAEFFWLIILIAAIRNSLDTVWQTIGTQLKTLFLVVIPSYLLLIFTISTTTFLVKLSNESVDYTFLFSKYNIPRILYVVFSFLIIPTLVSFGKEVESLPTDVENIVTVSGDSPLKKLLAFYYKVVDNTRSFLHEHGKNIGKFLVYSILLYAFILTIEALFSFTWNERFNQSILLVLSIVKAYFSLSVLTALVLFFSPVAQEQLQKN
ncbi:MAG: hypothetical protein WCP97_04925 [bacterium]